MVYPDKTWPEKDIEDLAKKAVNGQKLTCPEDKQKVDYKISSYPEKGYNIINLSCFNCGRKATKVMRI